jgi:hypothetical protein
MHMVVHLSRDREPPPSLCRLGMPSQECPQARYYDFKVRSERKRIEKLRTCIAIQESAAW